LTNEVNEIEQTEEVPLKLFKLEFAYSDPTTGSVLVSAPSKERAIEIALEAVPEHIEDFRITDSEEISQEAFVALVQQREEGPTVH
jgi:hypothetical protein